MADAPNKVTPNQIVPRASIMGPQDFAHFTVLLDDGTTYQSQGMSGDAIITGVKLSLGTMAFQDANSVNITGGTIVVTSVNAGSFVGGDATFATTQVGGLTATNLIVNGPTSLDTVQIGTLSVTNLAVSGTSTLHTTQVSTLTATSLAVSGNTILSTTQVGALTATSLAVSGNSTFSTVQIGGLLTATAGAAITGATSVTGAYNLAGASSPLLLNGDPGTAGQFQQSTGPGATPIWVTPPAGVNPADLYILTAQNSSTTANSGARLRVTAVSTITIGTLSSTQSIVLARDTSAGAVFVNAGVQTIDGNTSFNFDVNKPIVLFECASAGVIVTRLIGYLPSP